MSEVAVRSDNIASQGDDKWKGIANTDKTREKYEKFIEITEKFFEPQKSTKQMKSGDQGDIPGAIVMIEKFRFHCKLCNKSYLGNIGSNFTIRNHLKVSFSINAINQLISKNFL